MYINDPSEFNSKPPLWYKGGVTKLTDKESHGLSSMSLTSTPKSKDMSMISPSVTVYSSLLPLGHTLFIVMYTVSGGSLRPALSTTVKVKKSWPGVSLQLCSYTNDPFVFISPAGIRTQFDGGWSIYAFIVNPRGLTAPISKPWVKSTTNCFPSSTA